MTGPGSGQQPPDGKGWVAKSRDGVALLLGIGVLVFEIGGSLFGRPVDAVLIGAGIVLIFGREAVR